MDILGGRLSQDIVFSVIAFFLNKGLWKEDKIVNVLQGWIFFCVD
jgi:uncharacterized membrane protein YqaE (UPF0057 family)